METTIYKQSERGYKQSRDGKWDKRGLMLWSGRQDCRTWYGVTPVGPVWALCSPHLPWRPLQTALLCTCSWWEPCQWLSPGSTPRCRRVGKGERRHRVTRQCQDTSLLFSVLCFCQSRTKTPFQLLTFAGLKQWKAQMGCADSAELNHSVPALGTSTGSLPLDHPPLFLLLQQDPSSLSLFLLTEVGNRSTGIKIRSLTQRRVIVMQGEVYVLLVMIHSLECNNFKQSVIIHREQSNISWGTVWKGSIYSYSGNVGSK